MARKRRKPSHRSSWRKWISTRWGSRVCASDRDARLRAHPRRPRHRIHDHHAVIERLYFADLVFPDMTFPNSNVYCSRPPCPIGRTGACARVDRRGFDRASSAQRCGARSTGRAANARHVARSYGAAARSSKPLLPRTRSQPRRLLRRQPMRKRALEDRDGAATRRLGLIPASPAPPSRLSIPAVRRQLARAGASSRQRSCPASRARCARSRAWRYRENPGHRRGRV